MKEEKLLECSNYTLYKRLVPIRLKAIKFFFFFDFIFLSFLKQQANEYFRLVFSSKLI